MQPPLGEGACSEAPWSPPMQPPLGEGAFSEAPPPTGADGGGEGTCGCGDCVCVRARACFVCLSDVLCTRARMCARVFACVVCVVYRRIVGCTHTHPVPASPLSRLSPGVRSGL